MDKQSNKLVEQAKVLQDTYNQQIKNLTTKELSSITTIPSIIGKCNTDKIAQQILEECNINTEELLKEGIKINDSNPDISKQDLAIELLAKVAGNKKYKKMNKIAKEMLKERWWEKND